MFQPEKYPAYQDLHDRLRASMSDVEWERAERNSINAHYTDAAYVSSIWDAVKALGFNGGRVLEPGSGSGTFIGKAPKDAKMVGVELDPTSAAISKLLYPDATIRNERFENTKVPDNYFDLTIGNVPFANTPFVDKETGTKHSLHNGVIAKSLRKTKPGGLVAVLTSHHTLDADGPGSTRARQEMANLGDLVGAVRMPSGAHDDAAGTPVVTDLLVFRKRAAGEPYGTRGGKSFVDANKIPVGDGEAPISSYFQEHPDNVMGTYQLGGLRKSDLQVIGDKNAAGGLTEALHRITEGDNDHVDAPDAVAGPADKAVAKSAPEPDLDHLDLLDAGDNHHEGFVSEGSETFTRTVTHNADGTPKKNPIKQSTTFTQVENGALVPFWTSKNQQAELKQLLHLRDLSRALLTEEAASDEETPRIKALRKSLNTAYDKYHAKFGPINRFTWARTGRKDPETGEEKMRRNLPQMGGFRDDPASAMVYALERFDSETQEASKASIFNKRTVAKRELATKADNPADAVNLSLETLGHVDLAQVAKALGKDEKSTREALRGLVFTDHDGSGRLIPNTEYLSGNVRAKLKEARAAAEDNPDLYENVRALEKVVPADLTAGEIDGRMGAAWVGEDDVRSFLSEILSDPSLRVEHGGGNIWKVQGNKGGVKATDEWGTQRKSAPDIAELLLKGSPIRVEDTIKGSYGEPDRKMLNVTETEAAQAKAEEMQERFAAWLWEDPARAARLQEVYNDKFNGIVLREYDTSELTLPGMSKRYQLRPHQNAAVRRIVSEPSALLAHEVGAGKTLEMVAGTMELRRLGMARKPAVVVPNHMLEQFSREFLEAYPNANILAAGTDDLSGEKRRRFVARAATGDWDAVVLTQGAFKKLGMSKENQEAYLRDQISDLRAQVAKQEERGERQSLTFKELQKQLDRRETKIQEKLDKLGDEATIGFEDTGIDYLMVDEAHMYKNLDRISNRRDLAIEGSDQATDLDMKINHLRNRNSSGRVVTFATATPIANSIGEAYTMQQYLRPDLLRDAGINDFDTWVSTFGTTVAEMEVAPQGGFRMKERFKRFRNVPELLKMFRVAADVKTAEDLKLPVPHIRNKGDEQNIVVPSSEEFMEFNDRRLAEAQADDSPAAILKYITAVSQGALDLRLVGEEGPPDKLTTAAAKIADVHNRTKDRSYPVDRKDPAAGMQSLKGSLQIVFSDAGTPNSDGRFSAYTALRDILVRDHGFSPESVRFIHDADNDQKKAELFKDARDGKVAVIVGSTAKMGVGTNVQDRAVALHHLDCPWRPADLQQREGRVERQGNLNGPTDDGGNGEGVELYRYMTEGSIDAYRWQTVKDKSVFIGQMMRGRLDVREIDDLSDQSMSLSVATALAAGNPHLLEKARADEDVKKFTRLDRKHNDSQRSLEGREEATRTQLGINKANAKQYATALPKRKDTSGEHFALDVAGQGKFSGTESRGKAGEALSQALAKVADDRFNGNEGSPHVIGEFGGFKITATGINRQGEERKIRVALDGVPGSATEVGADVKTSTGSGVLTRLENRLDGMDARAADTDARIGQLNSELVNIQARKGAKSPYLEQLADSQKKADLLGALIEAEENKTGDVEGRVEKARKIKAELDDLKSRTEKAKPQEPTYEGHLDEDVPPAPSQAQVVETAEELGLIDTPTEPVTLTRDDFDADRGALPTPEAAADGDAVPAPRKTYRDENYEKQLADTAGIWDTFNAVSQGRSREGSKAEAEGKVPNDEQVEKAKAWIERNPDREAYIDAHRQELEELRQKAKDLGIEDALAPQRKPTEDAPTSEETPTEATPEVAGSGGGDKTPDVPDAPSAEVPDPAGEFDADGMGDIIPTEKGRAKVRTTKGNAYITRGAGGLWFVTYPDETGSGGDTSRKRALETLRSWLRNENGEPVTAEQQARIDQLKAENDAIEKDLVDQGHLPADDAPEISSDEIDTPEVVQAEETAAEAAQKAHDAAYDAAKAEGATEKDAKHAAAIAEADEATSDADVTAERPIPHGPVDEAHKAAIDAIENPKTPTQLDSEKFPLTPQQQAVADAVVAEGKDVKVEAKAGAGKTSTLEAIARRFKELKPDTKIAYIAFNKSVQTEAEGRMPNNVEARTGHSLAWAWAGKELTDKKDRSGMLRRGDEIASHLGIRGSMPNEDGDSIEPSMQAQIVMRAVDKYAYSDDDNLELKHFGDDLHGLSDADQVKLLTYAKKAWADLKNPDGKVAISFDHLRKMWALSRPDLTKSGAGLRRGANVLFLDEAQDTPPVLAKVVADQKMQKVIVGDADQAIYGFTGATDYLSSADADVALPLTKSWRFGPQVADWGNRFLQLLGSKDRVEGGGGPSKIVRGMDDADAILVRSNSGMLAEILREQENDRLVGVPKGTKKDLESLIETARYLKGEGRAPSRMHEDLAPYRTWTEFEKAAEAENADPKTKMLHDLLTSYGTDGLDEIVSKIVELDDPGDALAGVTTDVDGDTMSLSGKTWPLNEKLKANGTSIGKAGFRWDSANKKWTIKGTPEQHQAALDRLKDLAGAPSGEKPDVVVSTAHKAKGLEWDRVRIGSDFKGPKINKLTGEEVMPSDEELRLNYVAVTRAGKELDPGSLDWVLAKTDPNGGTPGAKPKVDLPAEQVAQDREDLDLPAVNDVPDRNDSSTDVPAGVPDEVNLPDLNDEDGSFDAEPLDPGAPEIADDVNLDPAERERRREERDRRKQYQSDRDDWHRRRRRRRPGNNNDNNNAGGGMPSGLAGVPIPDVPDLPFNGRIETGPSASKIVPGKARDGRDLSELSNDELNAETAFLTGELDKPTSEIEDPDALDAAYDAAKAEMGARFKDGRIGQDEPSPKPQATEEFPPSPKASDPVLSMLAEVAHEFDNNDAAATDGVSQVGFNPIALRSAIAKGYLRHEVIGDSNTEGGPNRLFITDAGRAEIAKYDAQAKANNPDAEGLVATIGRNLNLPTREDFDADRAEAANVAATAEAAPTRTDPDGLRTFVDVKPGDTAYLQTGYGWGPITVTSVEPALPDSDKPADADQLIIKGTTEDGQPTFKHMLATDLAPVDRDEMMEFAKISDARARAAAGRPSKAEEAEAHRLRQEAYDAAPLAGTLYEQSGATGTIKPSASVLNQLSESGWQGSRNPSESAVASAVTALLAGEPIDAQQARDLADTARGAGLARQIENTMREKNFARGLVNFAGKLDVLADDLDGKNGTTTVARAEVAATSTPEAPDVPSADAPEAPTTGEAQGPETLINGVLPVEGPELPTAEGDQYDADQIGHLISSGAKVMAVTADGSGTPGWFIARRPNDPTDSYRFMSMTATDESQSHLIPAENLSSVYALDEPVTIPGEPVDASELRPGTQVFARGTGGKRVTGVLEGTSPSGLPLVRTENGDLERIPAGNKVRPIMGHYPEGKEPTSAAFAPNPGVWGAGDDDSLAVGVPGQYSAGIRPDGKGGYDFTVVGAPGSGIDRIDGHATSVSEAKRKIADDLYERAMDETSPSRVTTMPGDDDQDRDDKSKELADDLVQMQGVRDSTPDKDALSPEESEETPEGPAPADGAPGGWVPTGELQPGSVANVDGDNGNGEATTRPGHVLGTPEPVEVNVPGKQPRKGTRTPVGDSPDGLEDRETVLSPAESVSLQAVRDEEEVGNSPAPKSADEAQILSGNTGDRLPVDSKGQGVFPGSTVKDRNGREGHVLETSDMDVKVKWTGKKKPARIRPGLLTVTDQVRPDGWTAGGRKVRIGDPVTDGKAHGIVGEISGDAIKVDHGDGTSTLHSAGDLTVGETEGTNEAGTVRAPAFPVPMSPEGIDVQPRAPHKPEDLPEGTESGLVAMRPGVLRDLVNLGIDADQTSPFDASQAAQRLRAGLPISRQQSEALSQLLDNILAKGQLTDDQQRSITYARNALNAMWTPIGDQPAEAPVLRKVDAFTRGDVIAVPNPKTGAVEWGTVAAWENMVNDNGVDLGARRVILEGPDGEQRNVLLDNDAEVYLLSAMPDDAATVPFEAPSNPIEVDRAYTEPRVKDRLEEAAEAAVKAELDGTDLEHDQYNAGRRLDTSLENSGANPDTLDPVSAAAEHAAEDVAEEVREKIERTKADHEPLSDETVAKAQERLQAMLREVANEVDVAEHAERALDAAAAAHNGADVNPPRKAEVDTARGRLIDAHRANIFALADQLSQLGHVDLAQELSNVAAKLAGAPDEELVQRAIRALAMGRPETNVDASRVRASMVRARQAFLASVLERLNGRTGRAVKAAVAAAKAAWKNDDRDTDAQITDAITAHTSGQQRTGRALVPGGFQDQLDHFNSMLPADTDMFGQVPGRRTFGRLTLDTLRGGKAPTLTDDPSSPRLDRSKDGGPGQQAADHLASLQGLGQAHLDEVNARIRAAHPDLGADPGTTVREAKRYADSVAADHRGDVNAAELKRLRKKALADYADKRARYASARRDAVLDVLGQSRSMGPNGAATLNVESRGADAAETKALRWAERFLPTDWLASAGTIDAQAGRVTKYEDGTITLSPDTDRGNGAYASSALMGLAQHLTETVPAIRTGLWAYHWNRTSSGTPGARHRTGKNALGYLRDLAPGTDLDNSWVSRLGEYGNPYAGVEDEAGYPKWLLALGLQELFNFDHNQLGDTQELHEDALALILGLMAYAGRNR